MCKDTLRCEHASYLQASPCPGQTGQLPKKRAHGDMLDASQTGKHVHLYDLFLALRSATQCVSMSSLEWAVTAYIRLSRRTRALISSRIKCATYMTMCLLA